MRSACHDLMMSDRQETEVVSLSEDKYAPVAYLRIKSAQLENKEHSVDFNVAVPPLLEPEYIELCSSIEGAVVPTLAGDPAIPSQTFAEAAHTKRNGPWLALSNVVAEDLSADASLEDEVAACFHRLQGNALP